MIAMYEDQLYKIDSFDESLLRLIPFDIDIVDESLNILYINKELEKKVGNGVIGKKCYEVYKDNCKQCAECPLKSNTDIGEVNTTEVDGVFGGRSLRIKHRAIEINGKRAILEVFEDITEHRRADMELQQSFQKLQRIMEGTVNALAITVENRDPYTAGHQQRVAQLACAIAKEIGLSQCQINSIHVAGTLHDIGKIYVPAEILSKPGRLTDVEFSLIKTHAQVGYEILRNIEFESPIAHIVLQHHERINGTGYPLGLKGDDILLEAKILAVADVVEAIHSHRPYRPAVGIDKALHEIAKNKGIYYDPIAVDACLKLFNNDEFKFA
jgi:putative nucleotidyltransferase with HDIG domain